MLPLLAVVRPGSKQRVWFGTVECSLGVCSVNVGAEGCVVGEWRDGIQFSLVEPGICSVRGGGSVRGLRT